MSFAAALPAIRSEGGLSRYLTEIHKFPLLSASEEATYAQRWRDDGDRDAAYQLVTSHLRLAAKIALQYKRYGLPIADQISEANVGLMLAIKRFDPERGCRLATYAAWWIKASVQEYILRSWSLVKLGTTPAQKKLFFNLRKLKSRIGAPEERDLSPEHVKYISEHLQVGETEVREMNGRMRGDISLNAPLSVAGEGDEWEDWLADPCPDPESLLLEGSDREQKKTALDQALAELSARERSILEARFLTEEPKTLDELAAVFHVSRERIRQIEQRALQRLRAKIGARLRHQMQFGLHRCR